MTKEEELKKDRARLKASLTRKTTKLKRLVAEKDRRSVLEQLDLLKEDMKALDNLSSEIVSEVDTDDIVGECDTYMEEIETKYVEQVDLAHEWLDSLVKTEDLNKSNNSMDSSLRSLMDTERELIQSLNLPKLELTVYDGNPLSYYNFITVFEESVEQIARSSSAKLSRLLKYTSGVANQAIASCAMLGGEAGYTLARQTLKERFGDDLIISQSVISSLKNGPAVKSSSELRVMADELFNSQLILKRLGNLHEVQSQTFIAAVVERCQPFMKGKWKKAATDMKKKHGCYPDFEYLVSFMKAEADIAADPVYGDEGLLKFNRVSSRGSSDSVRLGTGNAGYNTGYRQRSAGNQPASSSQKVQGNVFVSSQGRQRFCKFCKQQDHVIFTCDGFKSLAAEQKLEYIIDQRLCENCLLSNHNVETCFRESQCKINGCMLKHSRFIHWLRVDNNSSLTNDNNHAATTESSNSKQHVSALCGKSVQVCVPIVQVKVNNKVKATVMLDTCSTTTFCTQELASKLGIEGVPIEYELSTLTSECLLKESKFIPTLFVEGVGEGKSVILNNVIVIKAIPAGKCSVNVEEYSHLRGIDAISFSSSVDILVGQDNAEALVPLEVRKGGSGEPFAVKTVLGWSLHGNAGGVNSTDVCGLVRAGKISGRIVAKFIQPEFSKFEASDSLESKVDRMWSLDQEGVGCDDVVNNSEDDSVIKLWDDEVVVVDGRYVLPIPWKDNIDVPNNLEAARARLKSLRNSLIKRELLSKYEMEMHKLFEKGYAEKVPKGESQNSKTWYLPHQAVVSEKKPGKLRVVFDCAAKFEGESLNDKCKQGPDLVNKLVHVLLRFREHELAIMGDVEAMYYQVRVKEEDRDMLRFLWVDENGEEVAYRMCAHIFGGVWCACISTYAMRRCLEDQQIEDELVRDVVSRSFYVDDCLRSESSSEELQKVVEDVKDVLKEGGFNLTKFVTNDEVVMKKIKEEDKAKEVKEFGQQVVSKVLGVKWDVQEDVFRINVNVQEREVTRRNMLSTIAMMYDPLGLVSPCIVAGRMIFQEATRLKLEWNEEVPEPIAGKWRIWVKTMGELDQVTFPRCMSPMSAEVIRYELHNFSDASEKGFGCCSYLKSVSSDGHVNVTLVMSRARVCPMKQVTIPRLELQAAVMAAQMSKVIEKESNLHIDKVYFWIDSKVALAYIQNEKKRLKMYVANRVAVIRSLSRSEQWRHVAGEDNPADMASRGVGPERLTSSMWQEGPRFLKEIGEEKKEEESIKEYAIEVEDEEVKKEERSRKEKKGEESIKEYAIEVEEKEIEDRKKEVEEKEKNRKKEEEGIKECAIKEKDRKKRIEEIRKEKKYDRKKEVGEEKGEKYEVEENDEEVRKEAVVMMNKKEEKDEENPIEKLVAYFSSWEKVKKSMAWLIKVKMRLKEKTNKERIKEVVTVNDMKQAEIIILKYEQQKKYEQEISLLKQYKGVQKSSSIKCLLPMLDGNGLMCVGGRINQGRYQDTDEFLCEGDIRVAVNPCIIPHDSPVTTLIVREYHQRAHQGTEWTLSLLREKYWITRARGVIKQVRRKCVTCKRLYDKPKNQQMADIPEERLRVVKPFQHVGIDCFGPFYIKQGRSEVKRYGCIFTCMNMRAVHIEKLSSLETDSFINCFRRFMARRGKPAKVWSDNGTNFVGAKPELMKCLQELDEEKIRKFGVKNEIEWIFNTPHASHMGGIWERQIRSIRKILSSLLEKHAEKLTDEVLETLFCEVEAMINSRPLTKLSEDVTDARALSPNQLLLLNDEMKGFPGKFTRDDAYKQRWRFIQHLSNEFWRRWLKEYIPELQKRHKWYDKQENLKVGDVVLLCEENTPRFLWPLGLIVEVKLGRDKLVRTVRVKTKATELVRPVSKVVKLEG